MAIFPWVSNTFMASPSWEEITSMEMEFYQKDSARNLEVISVVLESSLWMGECSLPDGKKNFKCIQEAWLWIQENFSALGAEKVWIMLG